MSAISPLSFANPYAYNLPLPAKQRSFIPDSLHKKIAEAAGKALTAYQGQRKEEPYN